MGLLFRHWIYIWGDFSMTHHGPTGCGMFVVRLIIETAGTLIGVAIGLWLARII